MLYDFATKKKKNQFHSPHYRFTFSIPVFRTSLVAAAAAAAASGQDPSTVRVPPIGSDSEEGVALSILQGLDEGLAGGLPPGLASLAASLQQVASGEYVSPGWRVEVFTTVLAERVAFAFFFFRCR